MAYTNQRELIRERARDRRGLASKESAADAQHMAGGAAVADRGSPVTMCEAFQATAARCPQQVALRTPGGAVTITWGQYAARVRQIAAGLAGLGAGRGHAVALMMTNRPEFHLVDTAAFHLGAAPFSVYNTLAAEQVRQVLANAGSRVVVCEQQLAPRLLAVRPVTVLDPDAAAAFAARHGIADPTPAALSEHAAVRAAVAAAVQNANGRLSRVEQIKRFAVLPVSWEPGGDELTPTMKLKRQAVTAKYADVIESLYAAQGQPHKPRRQHRATAIS